MENKKYYTQNSSQNNGNQNYYKNEQYHSYNKNDSNKNSNNFTSNDNKPAVTYRTSFGINRTNETKTTDNSSYYSNKYNNNTNYNKHSNTKDWCFRYSRNGMIRSNITEEDEVFFKEHVEAMSKKKCLESEEFQKDCLVSFKNEEIHDKPNFTMFKEIELANQLQINLEKMQFSKMTPIQRAVITYILQGKDVMGCAQTGSGKTVAFLLPIINKMLAEGPPETTGSKRPCSLPVALILVPTRELAEQIFKEARKLISNSGINVVKVYGGVPHDSQIRELKYGCDILVATPGRLLDFIESGLITLKTVKYFIIDEADRILDMGFEPQLNKIAFEVDMPDKVERQNLLFSATFSDDIKVLAKRFMNEYYFISTYKDNNANANANIKHILMYCTDDQKSLKLHMILQQVQGSVIIFLDTKRGVDNLSNFLNDANYNTIAIHGDKTQVKRLEAIDMFTKGDVPILIATDVASRGLDFPSVSYVINFEMPTNIEDYVHRIGRTGRVGNSGIAISFVNEGNKPIIKDLYFLMKKLNQEIPSWFESMYYNVKDYKPSNNHYSHKSSGNNSNKFNSNKKSSSDRNEQTYNTNNRRDKSPRNDMNNNGMKKPIFFNLSKPTENKYSNNGTNSNY